MYIILVPLKQRAEERKPLRGSCFASVSSSRTIHNAADRPRLFANTCVILGSATLKPESILHPCHLHRLQLQPIPAPLAFPPCPLPSSVTFITSVLLCIVYRCPSGHGGVLIAFSKGRLVSLVLAWDSEWSSLRAKSPYWLQGVLAGDKTPLFSLPTYSSPFRDRHCPFFSFLFYLHIMILL